MRDFNSKKTVSVAADHVHAQNYSLGSAGSLHGGAGYL